MLAPLRAELVALRAAELAVLRALTALCAEPEALWPVEAVSERVVLPRG